MSQLKNIFLILSFLVCYVVQGQTLTNYTFVEYGLQSTPQAGGFSLLFKRESIGDSIYKETGLFSVDSAKTCTFKKVRGIWQIKINNEWLLFFDGCNQVNTSIVIDKYTYKIKWQKTIYMDEDFSIYKLQLIPVGILISGNPTYYFTYKDGIIAISGHDSFSARNDKKGIWNILNK